MPETEESIRATIFKLQDQRDIIQMDINALLDKRDRITAKLDSASNKYWAMLNKDRTAS